MLLIAVLRVDYLCNQHGKTRAFLESNAWGSAKHVSQLVSELGAPGFPSKSQHTASFMRTFRPTTGYDLSAGVRCRPCQHNHTQGPLQIPPPTPRF